ncbi:MAG: HGGxSTG domain-containing protein [Alphaproteobacteria bacterium]|nr:HGGxSTG domain-containing protein [Alphaproteobacteria bacterium]
MKRNRQRCGARRKRDGLPCEGGVVPGRTRCRYHGGLSTGPRTPEGKARIGQAQKRRWAGWRSRNAGATFVQT